MRIVTLIENMQVKGFGQISSRMSFLEAVRDKLREDYEEYLEKQTTKMLRVVELQIQVKTSGFSVKDLLHKIDPSAPIPQPLEGGNMEGPLYQCVLRLEKMDRLQRYCEENFKDIKIYSGCLSFDLEESLYRPDFYVQWQMGSVPTVTLKQ